MEEDQHELYERVNRLVCKEGINIKLMDEKEKMILKEFQEGYDFAKLVLARMMTEDFPDESVKQLQSFIDHFEKYN